MKDHEPHQFTLLPPLELLEDEEGNVESLDHYLARLGHCVGLTLPAMARMLVREPLPPGCALSTRANRSAWIGPGDRVGESVERLGAATGVPDLHRGTFLHISPVLSGVGFANCDSSANARKWCPRCYFDWNNKSSFEPLYWSFGALAFCPVHKCRMLSRCPKCGCRQHHGASYPKRRHCRSCREPLSGLAPPEEVPNYQAWVDRQCVMTAIASSNAHHPVAPDSFDRYFERVLSRWHEGEPIPKYVKASMANLESRWKKGERYLKPTIVQYLNFASFHGTNVDEIILWPESAAAEPLIEGARKSFTHVTLRRPVAATLERLRGALSRLLASDIPELPTAAAICTCFEVEIGYARERMREVVDAYSSVVKMQDRRHSKQALRRAFSCAIALFRENEESSLPKSSTSELRLISAGARCSDEVSRLAHRAAKITLSER